MTNNHVHTLDIIIADLSALISSQDNTWRKIAAMEKYRGIPAGTLCAIAKGREPKKKEHRKILGLPPVPIEVEPCPDCGNVHIVEWCTEKDGQPVKPKRQPAKRRPTRPYFKCRPDDITQVQRQLEKHYPGYELVRKER